MINTCFQLFDLTTASKDWPVAADWLDDHGHPLAHVFRTRQYRLLDQYSAWGDAMSGGTGSAIGFGSGSGYGDGRGSGSGYGDGLGSGSGIGYGSGCGSGRGTGDGNGFSAGSGNGSGSGE